MCTTRKKHTYYSPEFRAEPGRIRKNLRENLTHNTCITLFHFFIIYIYFFYSAIPYYSSLLAMDNGYSAGSSWNVGYVLNTLSRECRSGTKCIILYILWRHVLLIFIEEEGEHVNFTIFVIFVFVVMMILQEHQIGFVVCQENQKACSLRHYGVEQAIEVHADWAH